MLVSTNHYQDLGKEYISCYGTTVYTAGVPSGGEKARPGVEAM